MADFLDPVDVATPAGGEGRVQGDDRLQEFKRAMDERIRREHSFPGAAGSGSARHAFLYGADAARPTDPATGTIFLNTTQGTLDFWNGASWTRLNGVWPQAAQATFSGLQNLTTSDVIIGAVSLTVAAGEGGNYLILPSWSLELVPDGSFSNARGRIYLNGFLNHTALQVKVTSDATDVVFAQHGGEPTILTLAAGDVVELRGSKTTAGPTAQVILARLCIVKVKG